MKMYLYLLLIAVLISIPSIYASSVLEEDLAGMKEYLPFYVGTYPYDAYAYRFPWHLYLNGSGYIDVYLENIYSINSSSIVKGYVIKENYSICIEAGFYGNVSLGNPFAIRFVKYYEDGSYDAIPINVIYHESGENGVIMIHIDYGFDLPIHYRYDCPSSPCYPHFVAMCIVFSNRLVRLYLINVIKFGSYYVVPYVNKTIAIYSSIDGWSIQFIKLLNGFKGYVSHVFIGETSYNHLLNVFDFYNNPYKYMQPAYVWYSYQRYLYSIIGEYEKDYLVFPPSNLTVVIDPMYSVYDRYSGKIVFFNPWYPTSYNPIAWTNASFASYAIIDSPVYAHKLYVFRNNPFVMRYGENAIVFRYFPPCIVSFASGEEIVPLGPEYLWYIPPWYVSEPLPNMINIYFPVMYINIPYRYTDYTYTTSTTTITQTIFIKTSTPATSPSPTPTGFDWSFILLLALLAVFGLGIAFALRR